VLVSSSPDHDTSVLTLFRLSTSISGSDFSVASATPLALVILGALAVAAVQTLHLDRMVATTGDSAGS
jgi:hypothetical protein